MYFEDRHRNLTPQGFSLHKRISKRYYRGDFMKVLELSVAAGAGHVRAAEAIKTGLLKYYGDVEVEVVDTLKYINPVIDKVVVGSYLRTLKSTPYLYKRLYEFADKDDAIAGFSEVVNDVLSLKLKGLVEDTCPDIIVCTHPFPIEMISILKRKGKINVPVIAILTDYAPHSFWLYDYIDAYVIPNEDFIEEIVEKGIERKRVYPIGIPVGEEFLTYIDKKEAKAKLGLEVDTPTLLVMGGGLGIGNMKTIFETISSSHLKVQMLCVTGRNKKLKKKLEELKEQSGNNAVILEYTDEVSLLMSASDILISKPGGLTIAEALIKGLPILINSAIPGQEEENAKYLMNNGIAARVKKGDSIITVISQLTGSKLRLKHMREMALEKSKPDSVKDICDLIFEMSIKQS
jgi:processive 1,2-diacylglycerol beta-glucosyltransferase